VKPPMDPEPQTDEPDDAVIVAISDYLDGGLPAARKTEIETKIASDPEWKRVHDELVETRNFLSGMQKARAPSTFAQDVTHTIHKRSAGHFFARRTFGDRVPFGVILAVAVVLLLAITIVLWSSSTGSLRVNHTNKGSATSEPIVSPE
jgi:anti-sigma factor RsiW